MPKEEKTMILKVVRQDKSGKKKYVAGYENINVQTGKALIEALAQEEANEFSGEILLIDLVEEGIERRQIPRVTDKNSKLVAYYYGHWIEEPLAFDYHTADNADVPAVLLFNTELDGSQMYQFATVPIYKDWCSEPNAFQKARKHAEALAVFLKDALNAFANTPEGLERYQQLKDEVGWD